MKKKQLKIRTAKSYNSRKDLRPEKLVKENCYYDLVGLAIIILLGIIIYSNSFSCSFHFDDFTSIVENKTIRNLSDIKAYGDLSYGRPFGYFTFALNYHFNQFDVWYYHLVNLIIHIINAVLVWWVTMLIFSSAAMRNHPIVKHKKILAFFTAMMFVSHPLATQSVTYIVQRFNLLVAMFYLLSFALYIQARLTDKGIIFKILLFSGSLISAGLAMLTKQNAFTLPFAVMLFELFFIRTNKFTINFRDYRVILFMAALLGMILIIPLKYSFSIFDPIAPSLGHTYTLTPITYLLTQFSVIVKYIQLLFLPADQHLDYNFPVSDNFFEIRTLLSFLVLLSLIILAIFFYKRNSIFSFGISWFFLTLLIESSIIPINDVIYEHRTYLPSFGFFLILSSGIYILLGEKHKYLAVAILTAIIGSNSYKTYERNKVWKDDITLLNDNVAKASDFARPITHRGTAYGKLGQWDKAIADFSRAIELNANYQEPYFNRGVAYGKLMQWDKAMVDFSRAIDLDQEFSAAYYNRGVALGNIGNWDKAIADYSRAIEIDSVYLEAYFNRGDAFGKLGQWENATADFSKVIQMDPDFRDAFSGRGIAYGNLKKFDLAISDFSRAIGMNPEIANEYYNRGVAYGNLGQWDKAIDDYTIVLRIDSAYSQAYANREIAYRNLMNKKRHQD